MENFKLTFKTPDVLDQGLSLEQKKFAGNFVEFDEYITIEFDPINFEAKAVRLE